VKKALTSGHVGGLGVAPMPEIDFSQFGDIETQPLTKINKLTGQFLHRNWVTVPHVTQFDEADITELEKFRKQLNAEHKNEGIRVTVLAFLMKALVSALKEYPRFNSSLDATGENLVLKKYIHIGVAVDTPDGLVVPVIRDCDRKSLIELASELIEASIKARDKKLSPADMSGGCISISSLGGIGGTAFTPIVNAPEVAILGVSRAQMKPVYIDGEFVPRLILPLSLSYDHRVIDGADGARFTSFLNKVLSDTRRLLL
jgi:pyruvate dehydrogenase E2 component (dihydrolipoamide acetyltransferase)